MQVADLRIADDNMDITCEIHWGRRFEDGKATVQVYGLYKNNLYEYIQGWIWKGIFLTDQFTSHSVKDF